MRNTCKTVEWGHTHTPRAYWPSVLHTYITLYTGCPQSNHCKHLCLYFIVVAERRDPEWEDSSAFWGWQTLSGFQTSESRPEQLLMNDKAWTSCSPFLCTVSFIHTSPLSSGNISGPSYAVVPQHTRRIPTVCFIKRSFVLMSFWSLFWDNHDLWNESVAWGPSVLVESTSRCLIG